MKTKLYCLSLFFSFLMLLSCSAQDKQNSSGSTDAAARLASFGFYMYETPIDVPEITIPALGGGTISTKDFIGKITLLNFWATWCPPCRAEMPSIERLHNAMKGKNFQIIAINSGDNQKQVSDFISKHGYTFPIYLDESHTLSSLFASRSIPITYLINKEGQFVGVRAGAMEYDQEKLIKIFKELADG